MQRVLSECQNYFPLGLMWSVFVGWLLQSPAQWDCQGLVFGGELVYRPLLAQGNEAQL